MIELILQILSIKSIIYNRNNKHSKVVNSVLVRQRYPSFCRIFKIEHVKIERHDEQVFEGMRTYASLIIMLGLGPAGCYINNGFFKGIEIYYPE